ncbi:hypothetical protein [Aurantiacibacter suaedae]|uniref:hypothetical protein n=1 Tax=Aurantiacibacter suaedae TaxID=2545755 RepID=UPI0010F4EAC0|nr:hypothetical protein [Aurantiacibacter suaedae]
MMLRFLLGVRTQKSGSTWLSNHHNTYPEVFQPSPKELHVFDAMLRQDVFGEFHAKAQLEHERRG